MSQVQTTTKTSRVASQKPGKETRVFDVPIKNSLLNAKHFRRMGDALWLFMWCVDHVTKEVLYEETGERIGLVLGNMPQRDEHIAGTLGCSVKTVRRWRRRLVENGYLGCRRTPNGYTLWVRKSKKWANTEPTGRVSDRTQSATHSKSDLPPRAIRVPESGNQTARSGQCNKTSLGTSPETFPEEQRASRATAPSDLEEKILATYRKAEVKPTWRNVERRKLRELAEGNGAGEILSALAMYLEDRDEWLLANSHPFCHFAKNFASLLEQVRERDQERLQEEFKSESFDPENLDLVEVELCGDGKTGHRMTVSRDTAKVWIGRGTAQACERRRQLPKDPVKVKAYGWEIRVIDRSKLKRYVAAKICVEVTE